MRVARDAFLFFIPLVLLGLLTFYLGFLILAFILWGAALFVLFFFRDPARSIPNQPGALLSPADGRVIRVEQEAHGTRVSIFLSVFNVHVTRAPVSGRISRVAHRPGKFLLAYDPRASLENEQMIFSIGDITFALIAGLVARRIIPWKREGEEVAMGDRMALIRFGSRADVLIPDGWNILVEARQKVRAGVSILASRREGS